VDAAAHYRQLLQLGRDEFLAAAAPAALVRYRTADEDPATSGMTTLSLDEEIEETLPHGRVGLDELDLQIFPLTKKPGASLMRARRTAASCAASRSVRAANSPCPRAPSSSWAMSR
jgi:hypothetical protein